MRKLKAISREWWHLELGGVLILCGVAIVKPPGFVDVFLSFLNKKYALGIPLYPPIPLGFALVLLGIGLIVFGEWKRKRKEPATIFAFRHESLGSFVTALCDEDLPRDLKGQSIREIGCDLSVYFSGGNCEPVPAIRLQQGKVSEIIAARKAFPEITVAYCGLVHIPLQFLAGCAFSTHSSIRLFELNRKTNRWESLVERGPHMAVLTNIMDQPAEARAVAIRISITYEVSRTDVTDVLPYPFEDIAIQLPTPRLDAIVSGDQVTAICDRFRRILDDIHGRVPKSHIVHVFYAGPASLGFSLGRQISRTIHHRVFVHNYTPTATPRYSWAIEVTSHGPAENMVAQKHQMEATN